MSMPHRITAAEGATAPALDPLPASQAAAASCRDLVAGAPFAMLELDREGRILFASPAAIALAAPNDRPLAGRFWGEAFCERRRGPATWRTLVEEAGRDRRVSATPPNGSRRTVEWRLVATGGAAGRPRGFLAYGTDLSAFAEHDSPFRQVFDHNPIPIWVCERGTHAFLEVNEAAIAAYGYCREQFLGMTILDLHPAEERLRFVRAIAAGRRRRVPSPPWRHLRADGSERLVEISGHDIAFRGRASHLVTALDVTERVMREKALSESEMRLRRSEAHLARAQRVAAVGSWEYDQVSGLTIWSDEIYRIFGVSPETFKPERRNIMRMIHEEDRDAAWRASEATITGEHERVTLDYRIVRPSGEIRIVHREAEAIRDDSGAVVGVIGTMRDTTELVAADEKRRELESQLIQAQKMDALGTLAGGIAHDLNNTLVPIIALTKLSMLALPESSRERDNLEIVYNAGTRARDLVKQILSFSRKESPLKRRLDLSAFLREILPLLRATIPATIRLESAIEDVPQIKGDAGRVYQIVVNVVANAAQAIGGSKGTITIGLSGDASPGFVRISVGDTGPGMDDATLRRIFEPFFTTKQIGEGTGLGLAIVGGIVADHGGHVEVKSAPGRGTIFSALLPQWADGEDTGDDS